MPASGQAVHLLIKSIRGRLGMTQAQLARRAGLPQSHVAKIETGKVDVQLSTLRRLLSAMYCEPEVSLRFLKTPERAVSERIVEVSRQRGLSREKRQELQRRPSSEIWEERPARAHWPARLVANEDPRDDVRFWLEKPPEERVAAVEFLREQWYALSGLKSRPRLVRTAELRERRP